MVPRWCSTAVSLLLSLPRTRLLSKSVIPNQHNSHHRHIHRRRHQDHTCLACRYSDMIINFSDRIMASLVNFSIGLSRRGEVFPRFWRCARPSRPRGASLYYNIVSSDCERSESLCICKRCYYDFLNPLISFVHQKHDALSVLDFDGTAQAWNKSERIFATSSSR